MAGADGFGWRRVIGATTRWGAPKLGHRGGAASEGRPLVAGITLNRAEIPNVVPVVLTSYYYGRSGQPCRRGGRQQALLRRRAVRASLRDHPRRHTGAAERAAAAATARFLLATLDLARSTRSS
eukprot:COSAG01_NODE_2481_length_7603_cov_4.629398_1_plen_124_part_00